MSHDIHLAVIGGSGLYRMPGLSDVERIAVETPYGSPSSPVVVGTLAGRRVAFLARHGEGHMLPPAAIPQRANLYALKTLGVRYIIGVNACGSLREDFAPGDLVVPDQVFDYTIGRRDRSFFDENIVAHVSVADPFDRALAQQLAASARAVGAVVHPQATFIVEDGPRFATRAESRIFKSWGCDIIGMTSVPEVFLAREAEMAYATLAHITDYDSWRPAEEGVTADMVMATFRENIARVEKTLAHAIEHFDASLPAPAHTALDGAIMTHLSEATAPAAQRLAPLLRRVLNR